MKAVLILPRRATYADYLAAEQNSETRHELIDGVIVAMAGDSDEHNAIRLSLARPPLRSRTPSRLGTPIRDSEILIRCDVSLEGTWIPSPSALEH